MTRPPHIYVVTGDTARNPSRSGIPTTVRSLVRELAWQQTERARVAFWNRHRHCLHLLPLEYSLGLAAEALRDSPTLVAGERIRAFPSWFPGRADERIALHRHPAHSPRLAGAWLLLPELMYGGDRVARLTAYARRYGMRMAAIFHDALPVQFPEYSRPGSAELHRTYMRGLAKMDLILPNSEVSAQAWQECLRHERIASPALRVVPLAAEIPGVPRATQPPADPAGPVRALCVSTVEPRKNHRALFEALAQMDEPPGDLPLEIDLVGAPDPAAPELVAAVAAAEGRFGGRLRWHRRVDAGSLRYLYEQSDFTIYPSVAEGFGLPITESLWYARPCLCANFGVMAEHALGGGCLTVDTRDTAALAQAVWQLATDASLRHRLAREATERPLKTWREYADDIVCALDEA